MCVCVCVCESVASQDSVYRTITASVHSDHSLRFMQLLLSFTRSQQGLFYVHRLSHLVSCTPHEAHKAASTRNSYYRRKKTIESSKIESRAVVVRAGRTSKRPLIHPAPPHGAKGGNLP